MSAKSVINAFNPRDVNDPKDSTADMESKLFL